MYTTNRRTTRHLTLPGLVALLMGIGFALWIAFQVVLPILDQVQQVTNVLK